MKTQKLILAIVLFAWASTQLCAQKITDTGSYRIDLGNYYMKKSRGQKALGYTLMAAGFGAAVGMVALWGNDNASFDSEWTGTILLGAVSVGCLAASWPTLAAGAKNKGKAEILLLNKYPEDRQLALDMANQYKKKERNNKIIAWSLLGAGFFTSVLTSSGNTETQTTISTVATIAMFASIPFSMSAAKNKGRASILLQNEGIPYSYLSRPSGLRSVGLSIPITR